MVGILGAVVGALLFGFLVPKESLSLGTAVVAVIGAAVFVGLARLLTRRTVHA